jgi:hypothetical protein
VKEVSGNKVIVDSSKSAAYALVLSETPNINLNVVHIVRDSRAVAYSWQRKKLMPEFHWSTVYMDQNGPITSSVAYYLPNVLLPLVKYRSARYMRIRYEDLVQEPRQELGRVECFMEDHAGISNVLLADNTFRLGVDHTVNGNPMRFQKGMLEVRPDEAWQHRMKPRDKWLVTALTWPLLFAYGYSGSRTDGA